MNTDTQTDDHLIELHDRDVAAVSEAVAALLPRFAAAGMTPVSLFEGAIKGATFAMLTSGASPAEVADLFDEAAETLRRLHGVTASRH